MKILLSEEEIKFWRGQWARRRREGAGNRKSPSYSIRRVFLRRERRYFRTLRFPFQRSRISSSHLQNRGHQFGCSAKKRDVHRSKEEPARRWRYTDFFCTFQSTRSQPFERHRTKDELRRSQRIVEKRSERSRRALRTGRSASRSDRTCFSHFHSRFQLLNKLYNKLKLCYKSKKNWQLNSRDISSSVHFSARNSFSFSKKNWIFKNPKQAQIKQLVSTTPIARDKKFEILIEPVFAHWKRCFYMGTPQKKPVARPWVTPINLLTFWC